MSSRSLRPATAPSCTQVDLVRPWYRRYSNDWFFYFRHSKWQRDCSFVISSPHQWYLSSRFFLQGKLDKKNSNQIWSQECLQAGDAWWILVVTGGPTRFFRFCPTCCAVSRSSPWRRLCSLVSSLISIYLSIRQTVRFSPKTLFPRGPLTLYDC